MHVLDRHISVLVSIVFCSGTLLAAGDGESRITLQDLVSGERLGEAALSPDGQEIALARDGQIVLMPAGGGWPVPLTTTTGGKSGLSWSPDGRRIAYASRGHIWVVPASGGEPRQLTHAPPGPGDHGEQPTARRAGRPPASGSCSRPGGTETRTSWS